MVVPIVAFVASVFFGILSGREWYRPNRKWKLFIIWTFFLVISLGFGIYDIVVKKREAEKEAETETNTSVLIPEKNTNGRIEWVLGGKPFLFDINNVDISKISFPLEGRRVFPFEGVNFVARLIDNKISVNTSIRDSSGNSILEMVNNEWNVNRPQYAYDRNYNDTALEVVDHMQNIVFQIEISRNRMTMNARFVKPDGQLIISFPITKGQFSFAGLANFESGNYKSINTTKLRPLFRYPSKTHSKEKIIYTTPDPFATPENIPQYPKVIRNPDQNWFMLIL